MDHAFDSVMIHWIYGSEIELSHGVGTILLSPTPGWQAHGRWDLTFHDDVLVKLLCFTVFPFLQASVCFKSGEGLMHSLYFAGVERFIVILGKMVFLSSFKCKSFLLVIWFVFFNVCLGDFWC